VCTQVVLLSTAFLGPIQYFTKFLKYPQVFIEQYENYPKQSYRNRCIILSANGKLPLTIPIVHNQGTKTYTKDIKIDNSKRWKIIHRRAIEAAYRSSAFYIYYIDYLNKIYEKDYTYLIDFNYNLLTLMLEILQIKANLKYTTSYKGISSPYDDFSMSIHPKEQYSLPDKSFNPVFYYQVFYDKYGFVPNLSIIDLLFNVGPESISILRHSIK